MNQINEDRLRKAAVLIASLDRETADALLHHMTPEEESRVRAAVMELDAVDDAEQEQVIREFVNRTPRPMHAALQNDGGVELDLSLLQQLEQEKNAPAEEAVRVREAATPFASLSRAEPSVLAHLLIREHPQTMAIVLSHLPPEKAAEVLACLPDHLQTEVLMRIARLTDPDPEILSDIESEMEALLAHTSQTFGRTGLAAVEAILQASQTNQRQRFVHGLASHDKQLVSHLQRTLPDELGQTAAEAPGGSAQRFPHTTDNNDRSQPSQAAVAEHPSRDPAIAAEPARRASAESQLPLTFDQLQHLDDAHLALVLRRADPRTTLLALAGASPEFLGRVLQRMPARDAKGLQQRLQQLGPIRLKDIELAQQHLAAIAQQLFGTENPDTINEPFVVAA